MKQFEVDWDNYDELSKLVNILKSRMGELNAEPKRTSNRVRFDACREIFCTDITSVFSGIELSPEPIFYVYAHLDTSRKIAVGRDGITTFASSLGLEFFPFYVGKGTGERCMSFARNETHRKITQKLSQLGKQPLVAKVADGLTEIEALSLESKLIDIFGLIPYGGVLTNLDEGIRKDDRRSLYRSSFNKLRRMHQIL